MFPTSMLLHINVFNNKFKTSNENIVIAKWKNRPWVTLVLSLNVNMWSIFFFFFFNLWLRVRAARYIFGREGYLYILLTGLIVKLAWGKVRETHQIYFVCTQSAIRIRSEDKGSNWGLYVILELRRRVGRKVLWDFKGEEGKLHGHEKANV